jgi:hypothetical protein
MWNTEFYIRYCDICKDFRVEIRPIHSHAIVSSGLRSDMVTLIDTALIPEPAFIVSVVNP